MKNGNDAWMTALMGAAACLFLAGPAFCDDPVAMAPPIVRVTVATPPADSATTAAGNVFQWTEVPQNQTVPIKRAVFDKGGYQLYDNVGETVAIPFASNNLYVMKFAVSPDGTMFFVNTGSAPVLYVPKDGYLENATVAGGRWYPFSADFQPSDPVYCGIAPSWADYCDMGWYPDMCCYGAYWSDMSFDGGGVFLPCIGFAFVIGGHHCDDWYGYVGYSMHHPAPFHTGYADRNAYRGSSDSGRPFGGASHSNMAEHAISTTHFQGAHGAFHPSSHSFSGGHEDFGGSHGGFGGDHESFSGGFGGNHFGGGFGGGGFGGHGGGGGR